MIKPMLAAVCDDLSKVKLPVLVSVKLDGIRCLIRNGKAWSRSGKLIPNEELQRFAPNLQEGSDGELMIEGAAFNEISSVFMSRDKSLPAEWCFAAFDLVLPDVPFLTRFAKLRTGNHQHQVVHTLCRNLEDLDREEASLLACGCEGMMIRDPNGMYKHGRSTLREGGLLKVKRFVDAESSVVGCEELMHNTNETKTVTGRRVTNAEGLVAGGVLGALVLANGTRVGSGFTLAQRIELWTDKPIGRLCKYKHLPHGAVDKPRHPVFIGWRDERDL